MKAGQKMDEKIHRLLDYTDDNGEYKTIGIVSPPPYSTDDTEALKVVKKLGKDHYFSFDQVSDDVISRQDYDGLYKYRCTFRKNSLCDGHGQSNSLAEAICLAALQVKGIIE